MRKQIATPARASQGFFMAALVFAIVITINLATGAVGASGSAYKTYKIDRLEYLKWYMMPVVLIVIGLVFRAYEKRGTNRSDR